MPRIGIGIDIARRSGAIDWSSYWATLISATVETAAPTHVVLTFPTAKTSLGATDFTIAGFTISSASWTGAVLTLVLSEAVLVFDGNLTITFVTTGQTATVTNNVADDGHTLMWFDPTATATITKDESNLVSSWKDRLASGRDLAQATEGNRPVHNTNYISFGSPRFMTTAAIAALDQPTTIYMVVRQNAWAAGKGYFQGVGGLDSGSIYQTGLTGNVAIRAGTAVAANAGLASGNWVVVRVVFNGASSKIQVNEAAATTGNAGAGNMGGITVGRIGASDYANFDVADMIFRDVDDDDGLELKIVQKLTAKYPLFFLTEEPEPDEWDTDNLIEIGWMTDNHIISTAVENPETPDIYGVIYAHTCKQATRQAIDKFNEREVDLILNTGDIVGDFDGVAHFMEEWTRGVAEKYLTLGNHDLIVSRADLISGFGYSEKSVNAGSCFNQTFVLDNSTGVDVRIIVVDSTRYLEDGSSYYGRCSETVRNWIAGILSDSAEDDVFIFMHQSPHTWEGTFVEEDAEALNTMIVADLAAHPNRRIKCIVGHDHGYGDLRIYSRPGWADWPCYIGHKAIADYEPGFLQNGGFYIIKLNEHGSVQVELFDKIFPYTS